MRGDFPERCHRCIRGFANTRHVAKVVAFVVESSWTCSLVGVAVTRLIRPLNVRFPHLFSVVLNRRDTGASVNVSPEFGARGLVSFSWERHSCPMPFDSARQTRRPPRGAKRLKPASTKKPRLRVWRGFDPLRALIKRTRCMRTLALNGTTLLPWRLAQPQPFALSRACPEPVEGKGDYAVASRSGPLPIMVRQAQHELKWTEVDRASQFFLMPFTGRISGQSCGPNQQVLPLLLLSFQPCTRNSKLRVRSMRASRGPFKQNRFLSCVSPVLFILRPAQTSVCALFQ